MSGSGDAAPSSSTKPPLEVRIEKRVNELKAQMKRFEGLYEEKLDMEECLVNYPDVLKRRLEARLSIDAEEIMKKAQKNVDKLMSSFDEKSRLAYEEQLEREEELRLLKEKKEKLENNLFERELLLNEYNAKFAELDRKSADLKCRKQRFEEFAAVKF